jgi:hypothetical protein
VTRDHNRAESTFLSPSIVLGIDFRIVCETIFLGIIVTSSIYSPKVVESRLSLCATI